MAGGEEHIVLRNYPMPRATRADSSIVRPAIEVHNFELRPVLVTFVETHPSENPNMHLRNFLAKCDIIKLNNVSTDAIRLRLLLFSLRDRASEWL